MLCMVCKQNQAKVHLTQIVGDKMQKVDLCEDCSKSKGVNDPAGFSLADLLLGLGASQEMEEATGGEQVRCPACGFTQADFKKTGRLGCSECYTTFADGLEGLLKTMHKGIRHVGKTPRALRQSRDLSDRLKQLQGLLEKAVSEENYEQAATLRDEIKSTRKQLNELATAES
ncbi:MAG TPA: UvrB/UvrC motif-containing protein [Methylomirabilota bacterium]|nr:UvrB/UvrC motif-containing protein [Methylomirabilota bacterium]